MLGMPSLVSAANCERSPRGCGTHEVSEWETIESVATGIPPSECEGSKQAMNVKRQGSSISEYTGTGRVAECREFGRLATKAGVQEKARLSLPCKRCRGPRGEGDWP